MRAFLFAAAAATSVAAFAPNATAAPPTADEEWWDRTERLVHAERVGWQLSMTGPGAKGAHVNGPVRRGPADLTVLSMGAGCNKGKSHINFAFGKSKGNVVVTYRIGDTPRSSFAGEDDGFFVMIKDLSAVIIAKQLLSAAQDDRITVTIRYAQGSNSLGSFTAKNAAKMLRQVAEYCNWYEKE